MEKVNENRIKSVSTKIGLLHIISYSLMFIPYTILYNLLNGDSNSSLVSLKSLVIYSLPLYLALFIAAIFIFEFDIRDIFLGRSSPFSLSSKAKIKLTLFFTSIYLFSSLISTYFMVKFIGSEVSETPFFKGEITEIVSKLIYLGILIPLIEEIIFRGIILRELRANGSLFAIIISSLVFMIPHTAGFFHAFVAGLILGLCYVLTGNIKWSIMFHIICNFGIAVIIGLFELFLPSVNLNIIRLAMGVILALVFFIVSKKDDELKAFHKTVNFNTAMDQLKKDRNKYKIFITSPLILIFIIFAIFRFLIPLI